MHTNNGREPCPKCGVRDTEKTGPYSYACHNCGCEWTDEERRERDRQRRKERQKRRRKRWY